MKAELELLLGFLEKSRAASLTALAQLRQDGAAVGGAGTSATATKG